MNGMIQFILRFIYMILSNTVRVAKIIFFVMINVA